MAWISIHLKYGGVEPWETHTCMHDIPLKTPRISSLAAEMFLEGDSQDWKAVEDRACMKFCTYAICGKEVRKDHGRGIQASGFEGKLIS